MSNVGTIVNASPNTVLAARVSRSTRAAASVATAAWSSQVARCVEPSVHVRPDRAERGRELVEMANHVVVGVVDAERIDVECIDWKQRHNAGAERCQRRRGSLARGRERGEAGLESRERVTRLRARHQHTRRPGH